MPYKTWLMFGGTLALILLSLTAVEAKVLTQLVEYRQDGTMMRGFLAYDDGLKGKRPRGAGGPRVVGTERLRPQPGAPPRRGLATSDSRSTCTARAGSPPIPTTHRRSWPRPRRTRRQWRRDSMRRATTHGRSTRRSEPDRGDRLLLRRRGGAGHGARGSQSGRSGELPRRPARTQPGDLQGLKASILVLHGADDPHVSPADLAAFEQAMREARADWQMVFFGGAVHGFARTRPRGITWPPG